MCLKKPDSPIITSLLYSQNSSCWMSSNLSTIQCWSETQDRVSHQYDIKSWESKQSIGVSSYNCSRAHLFLLCQKSCFLWMFKSFKNYLITCLEKARHSDNCIIIVLKNNHGQWAVICQRFITNQRLRLAQKCDMICVESQSKDIEA